MTPPRTEEFIAPSEIPGESLFAPSLDPAAAAREPTSAKRIARGLGISLRRPGRPDAPTPPQPDDAFATLIAPLSPGEVERLRRSLEQDECLYDRFERARVRAEAAQLGGAAIAAVLAVSLILAWRDWILAVRDIVPAQWLADLVGAHAAEATTFVAAILLAVAWLGLIARAGADLLRGAGERRMAPFIIALVELALALPAGVALFIPQLPAAAIFVALGIGLGWLARLLTERRMRL